MGADPVTQGKAQTGMNLSTLQSHLRQTGRYAGAVDGLRGKLTEAGVLLMLTDGPDTAQTTQGT